MSNFGERLRARRIALSITQKELANRVGIDPSSIRNYEKARSVPRGPILKALESVLSISLRQPFSLMTPEHLSLRPVYISEKDWIEQLETLFDSFLKFKKEFYALARLEPGDIKEEAAVEARGTQLWGHDLVKCIGGRVHYWLERDSDGTRRWVSNVVEDAEGKDADESVP